MEKQRIQAIGMLVAAALLLILLSASLHEVTFAPGHSFAFNLMLQMPGRVGTGEPVAIPGWIGPLSAILIVLIVIALIVSPTLRRDLIRNLPPILLAVLGLYLLLRSSNQQPIKVQSNAPPPAASPSMGNMPTLSAPPDFVAHPPEWLVFGLTLLLAIGLLGVAFWLFRRFRRVPAAIDRLVDEVREALADLQSGADLRDTITRCYAEMVQLLVEQRGVQQDHSLTPREFELRLAAVGMGDSHIQRLTRLFERVRYSPHTPGTSEEQEASACLSAIIEAYARK